MSNQQHTLEPWRANDAQADIDGPNGEPVAVCYCNDDVGDDAIANARRIVACVNACAGIPTERLEEFNDWSAAGIASAATYRQQRDELLAALEKMNRAYVCLMENGRDRIISLGGECDSVDVMERSDQHLRESRAAIASVKGGAA